MACVLLLVSCLSPESAVGGALAFVLLTQPPTCLKTLLAIAGSIALAALLLAQAQTPATTHDNPTPATPTPKPATKRQPAPGASPNQTVGQKFMEKSKPDARPIKLQPRPVRKD